MENGNMHQNKFEILKEDKSGWKKNIGTEAAGNQIKKTSQKL